MGNDIYRLLAQQGQPVRALMRTTSDPAKAAWQSLGIELVEGDLKDPASLAHVPAEASEAQRAAATDPIQQSFAALMLSVTQGDEVDRQATAQQFSLTLTSVEDHARQTLAA